MKQKIPLNKRTKSSYIFLSEDKDISVSVKKAKIEGDTPQFITVEISFTK